MGRDADLKQMEMAKQRQQFAAAVAANQVVPRDRFGVPITAGRLVMYRPNADMVFQVADVSPVVDPRMPTGMVTVMLTIQAPITIPVGKPIINMIVIGTQALPTDAPAETPPVDPPPTDPPIVLSDVD